MTPIELSEISVTDGIEGTLQKFRSALGETETGRRVAEICKPESELDALRNELARLRRRNEAMNARLNHIQDDLTSAAIIQREIEGMNLPQPENARITRFQRPAEALSGDLCHLKKIDDHKTVITVADATGHGVSAAMLTVFCRPLLCQSVHRDPAAALQDLNQVICAIDFSGCQFMSAIQAIYDDRDQTLTWSRAGAPLPVLQSPGHRSKHLDGGGPLLGMDPDAQFETCRSKLNDGDRVLLNTDGLDDLLFHDFERFHTGPRNVREWIDSLPEARPEDIMLDLEKRFCAADHQQWEVDDVSVIMLENHIRTDNSTA